SGSFYPLDPQLERDIPGLKPRSVLTKPTFVGSAAPSHDGGFRLVQTGVLELIPVGLRADGFVRKSRRGRAYWDRLLTPGRLAHPLFCDALDAHVGAQDFRDEH